jgi:hypothetical protein
VLRRRSSPEQGADCLRPNLASHRAQRISLKRKIQRGRGGPAPTDKTIQNLRARVGARLKRRSFEPGAVAIDPLARGAIARWPLVAGVAISLKRKVLKRNPWYWPRDAGAPTDKKFRFEIGKRESRRESKRLHLHFIPADLLTRKRRAAGDYSRIILPTWGNSRVDLLLGAIV